MGVVAKNNGSSNSSMAKAGIILSIVSLSLQVLMIILIIIGVIVDGDININV